MKLIKISPAHYVIVDDSEIQQGDYVYNHAHSRIEVFRSGGFGLCRKITHSTKPDKGMETVTFIPLQEVEELVNGYSVESVMNVLVGGKAIKDNKIDLNAYGNGIIAGFNSHKELVKDKLSKYEQVVSILDDIQKDLSDYQNEVGIGMMDDGEWQELFVQRVISSINSYETSLQPKTEWEVEFDEQDKLKLI